MAETAASVTRRDGRSALLRASPLAALVARAGCKKAEAPRADAHFYKKTQQALSIAKPGAVIELPGGRFELDRSLSSSVGGVPSRGKGPDKTVLSFKGQTQGAEGLLVKGNNITLEDFAIEDTKGDAIKVNGTDGL